MQRTHRMDADADADADVDAAWQSSYAKDDCNRRDRRHCEEEEEAAAELAAHRDGRGQGQNTQMASIMSHHVIFP